MTYKPGKDLYVAHTFSRLYLQEIKEQLVPEAEISAITPKVVHTHPTRKVSTAPGRNCERHWTDRTEQCGSQRWPDNREDVPPSFRQYWSCRDELTCLDGVPFKGDKLIVPKTLQSEMLQKIHDQFGIVKCKSRASSVLFWPGMSSQIGETLAACRVCAEHSRANPKEPLIPVEVPDRPWAKFGADLFELNTHHYPVMVDCFSNWPEISKLDNLTVTNLISYIKSQIPRYGIPDEVITDNGSQFARAELAQL